MLFSKKRSRDRKSGFSKSSNSNRKRSLSSLGMTSASFQSLTKKLSRNVKSNFVNKQIKRINLLVYKLKSPMLMRMNNSLKAKKRSLQMRNKKRKKPRKEENTPTLRN